MEKMDYSQVIHDFRNFVDEHQEMLILLSGKEEYEYMWNRVCSSMDWITVITDHLNNNDAMADCFNKLDMFSYLCICCIDIMSECIKLLHKTFVDKHTSPFGGEKRIFVNNPLGQDDNTYFKNIRAVFGAHPVAVKLETKKPELRYASWPTHAYDDVFDICVRLYAEKQNSEDVVFGFKIDQLNSFFWSRYEYLSTIKKGILEKLKAYEGTCKNKPITQSSDPNETVENLLLENEQRLGCEYYEQILKEIKLFLSTKFSYGGNALSVGKYRELILDQLNVLHRKIQDMEVTELPIYNLLHPKAKVDNHFHYAMEKLSEAVYGENLNPIIMIDKLKENIEPFVKLEYSDYAELLWLCKIGLYIKSLGQSE